MTESNTCVLNIKKQVTKNMNILKHSSFNSFSFYHCCISLYSADLFTYSYLRSHITADGDFRLTLKITTKVNGMYQAETKEGTVLAMQLKRSL